ncbi:zinc finger, CCHC-type containing protein [Tanacetum coccineum]
MKSYLDTLECLGYAMPKELGVILILNSLNNDYNQFVQNYNMHSMGKTLAELHAMLKLFEKGIPKKAKTSAVLAIREGKIQKDKKKPQGENGKGKGKNKLAYAPKAKIPPPPKRDNPAKDSICHHCKEVGHWRRNCSSYHAKLKKRNNANVASTSVVSGSHGLLEMSGSDKWLELIQEEDTQPSENTSKAHNEVAPIEQASRSWNKRFDEEIKKISFTQNPNEPCVYLKASGSNVAFLVLYVDDILLMGNSVTMLQDVKSWLSVDWKSAKKSTIAMSSTEAENIAVAKASMEAIWMRKFIDGLGDVMPSIKRPIEMLCDNENALAIASDPKILKGARHFSEEISLHL